MHPLPSSALCQSGRILSVVVLAGLLFGACVWSPDPPGDTPPWKGRDDLGPGPTVIPPGSTIVTFSFADTVSNQARVGEIFNKYGLRATFYMSSGRIGRSGYLTLDQIRALATAGHEIGSHTVNHTDLDTVSIDVARREICDDRAALMSLGFPVTSFAYPFSSDSLTARQLVIGCNFNNARAVGGIRNPDGCSSCPVAETIPPADPFLIRTPTSVKSDWTLAELQSLVLQVEAAGGGWMLISMHGVCPGSATCSDTYDIPETRLDELLAWLAPRTSRGTFVMTTHEVVGGPVKPPLWSDGGTFPFDAGTPDAGRPDAGADAGVPDAGTDAGVPDAGRDAGVPDAGRDAGVPDAGTDAGVPDAGTDAGTPVVIPLPNPSLELDSDGDNVPDCWKRQNLGTNSGGWLRTTEAHTGSWAQRPRISSYTSGDRRLVVTQDTGACAPAATPGRSYRVSAWYKTDSRVAFVAAYRISTGTWVTTWAAGPDLPTSPTIYVRGEWVTPPLPPGATHISVGLALRGVGFAVMDDFVLERLGSTPFAPERVDPAPPDDAAGPRLHDAQPSEENAPMERGD
ncbi:polysaccharide deacetylase family protein [Vitiosangium sp. GDMCC 1.1324]|uniref:polysaccharide deacetylase family protein n=1 Tax=Vitiosangium sp. (strain GDMCC 1.1324) TaxID=2138576 RepID=UPI000D3D97AD|nr:polysaccharide deacetylase family protein [Vitiosangium sp. GDMCC 1.1324]PTL82461.1 xylanase [Vitiosangium sp. GDMCC 1.1324]